MALTIGTTQAQYFIPEIWAQTAIPILRSNIVVAPRVTRDTDVAAFTRGDILHIPYPGTLAASAKAAGTQYVLAQPSNESEVQVSLSQYQAVSFIIEDIVRAQENMDLIAVYSTAAAIALAEQLETYLFTTLSAGTTAPVGTAGTNLSAATLQTVWKTLTDLKVPQDNRNLVISTKDQIALLADTALTNYFAFSQTRAESAADLGDLYGLHTFSSQLVPTVAGTPVETDNFAWRSDGIILAMRGLPEPPPHTGAVAANVRDPLSGIVMRVVMAYDAAYGGVRITMELLYGAAVLQQAKVLKVKS